jgi:hypothetical protein
MTQQNVVSIQHVSPAFLIHSTRTHHPGIHCWRIRVRLVLDAVLGPLDETSVHLILMVIVLISVLSIMIGEHLWYRLVRMPSLESNNSRLDM